MKSPFPRLCSQSTKRSKLGTSGQNSKYCKKTVKWRTANVFTVKQLTICPGWLLRKTILEGFQWSGNFVLQEIGSRRALHQGWKWAFKVREGSFENITPQSCHWPQPSSDHVKNMGILGYIWIYAKYNSCLEREWQKIVHYLLLPSYWDWLTVKCIGCVCLTKSC